MICYIEESEAKFSIVRDILYKLPEWFGIEESIKEYIEGCKDKPLWAYLDGNEAIGFVALKETSPYTVEIYVMGVLKNCHRKSIGTELFRSCFEYSKQQGYLFMQVKTVKEGLYKEYDMTNKFYKSLGFKELECLSNLWDGYNPCQVYVMSIR